MRNNVFEDRMQAIAASLDGYEYLWATDIDGTVITDSMAPAVLHFCDPALKAEWDFLRFVKKSLTTAQHLRLCMEGMLERAGGLAEVIAFGKSNCTLKPGFAEFRRKLAQHGAGIAGFTNNAEQLVEPVIQHLGSHFPVLGNWLDEAERFYTRHGEIGLDKGEPIRWLANHGFKIVGYAGDGIGDIEGGLATRALGGTVVAVGENADGYASDFHSLADHRITDYHSILDQVPAFVEQARIASLSRRSC